MSTSLPHTTYSSSHPQPLLSPNALTAFQDSFQEKLRKEVQDLESQVIAQGILLETKGFHSPLHPSEFERLIRLLHLDHILQLTGGKPSDLIEAVSRRVEEAVLQLPHGELQLQATLKVQLIRSHKSVWQTAEYFYEKASKTLCQMMVTLLGTMIQDVKGTPLFYY